MTNRQVDALVFITLCPFICLLSYQNELNAVLGQVKTEQHL